MDMLSPRAGRTFTVEFLFNDIKGEVLKQRIASSLLLTFAGDALASPAHWYYNLNQLKADHGVIQGYVKPKKHMQGSIMNLSSTSGGGRGRDDGDIIGGVINHGKKIYWQRNGNFHYHCSLEAGESTLEGSLCQLLLKFFAENHLQFDKSEYLKTFEKFMTEPGSHNDTYASTYLRQFFANRIKGKPLNECADNDGHNTDAIDALTCLVPTTVVWCLTHESNLNERQSLHALISDVLSATRKSTVLPQFGVLFADLLVDVLAAPSSQTATDNNNADAGAVLREAVVNCGQKLNLDVKQMVEQHYSRSDPMVACYIDSSFPALLAFAYKYADNPERALLASVNAGGENVARSSALGALLGAAHGSTAVFDGTSPHWLVADLLATNSVGYCISDLFNEQQRSCSDKE